MVQVLFAYPKVLKDTSKNQAKDLQNISKEIKNLASLIKDISFEVNRIKTSVDSNIEDISQESTKNHSIILKEIKLLIENISANSKKHKQLTILLIVGLSIIILLLGVILFR